MVLKNKFFTLEYFYTRITRSRGLIRFGRIFRILLIIFTFVRLRRYSLPIKAGLKIIEREEVVANFFFFWQRSG